MIQNSVSIFFEEDMKRINIIPLIVYLIVLILLVYLTGISQEILLLFPLNIIIVAVWFMIPFFIGMLTARLSESGIYWRVLFATLASLAINFMLPFSFRRIWIHGGFYNYVSLRGFISIIWNDRHMLAMSFIIMFFVIWAGEEIANGCKKERNAARDSKDNLSI